MKNFTTFLLISLVLYSCSKQNASPNGNPTNSTGRPPSNAAPATNVSIIIDGQVMHITSLSYQRHRSTSGGGLSITASNSIQKVTAVASPFSSYNPPWSMIYLMEVSYFVRADSLSSWGVTYPRVVPRDDQIKFDNADPLSDKVVKGNFSASFIESNSDIKDEHRIILTGNFTLVF